MTFYHVNTVTMRSGPCYSSRGDCPLEDDFHFTSSEAAQYFLSHGQPSTEELSTDELLKELDPFLRDGRISKILSEALAEEDPSGTQEVEALAFLLKALKFEEERTYSLASSEGEKLLKLFGSYERLIGVRSLTSDIAYELVDLRRRMVKKGL